MFLLDPLYLGDNGGGVKLKRLAFNPRHESLYRVEVRVSYHVGHLSTRF
jgi:hypothetical protein